MISAEHLQDAMGLLPEEMLVPVDALRRQKRISWKPFAAVAASLLLVVGLWWLQPVTKSAESGKGMEDAAENVLADGFAGNSSFSEHATELYAYSLTVKVTEVTEDYWVVTLPDKTEAKAYLDNLEKPATLTLGADIVLLFYEAPGDLQQLYPNKIIVD